MHPWQRSKHYPFQHNNPCNQLGCMYITARVGFDLAVGLPTHIYLVALHSHNTTTIQIALFTAFGGAIEHSKTSTPFLPCVHLRHLQFRTSHSQPLKNRGQHERGRSQGGCKCSHQVKMHSYGHWQFLLRILDLQEDPTQQIPFLWGVRNKIGLLVGIIILWQGASINLESQIQLTPQGNFTTLPSIKLNAEEPNNCFREEIPNGV